MSRYPASTDIVPSTPQRAGGSAPSGGGMEVLWATTEG